MSGTLTVTQKFKDERVMVSNGTYASELADKFALEKLMWLPNVVAPVCPDSVPDGPDYKVTGGFVTVEYPFVTVQRIFRGRGCKVSTNWEFFPFDTQKADFHVQPKDPAVIKWNFSRSLCGPETPEVSSFFCHTLILYKLDEYVHIAGISVVIYNRYMLF